MKPTQDIIDELRVLAAASGANPPLAESLNEAADRIEHLYASGIHSCHADCQRPMCVLRRERDKALAELERVTAERDEVSGKLNREIEAEDFRERYLRARVAELEAAR